MVVLIYKMPNIQLIKTAMRSLSFLFIHMKVLQAMDQISQIDCRLTSQFRRKHAWSIQKKI